MSFLPAGTFAWGEPYLMTCPLELNGLGASMRGDQGNADEAQEVPCRPFKHLTEEL